MLLDQKRCTYTLSVIYMHTKTLQDSHKTEVTGLVGYGSALHSATVSIYTYLPPKHYSIYGIL